ncbi:hypothetical protein GOP47_0020336 [Adiantum capillus-veneris]|uniref:Glycosyltransferase n=1 Tax=Adiantum capillus-veneris TaxID=13818 RepID=A0A9D4UEB8_ADICA|nr:hypothetical protein GOP47_0020336 [Adiantum capillus-veneris]
MPSPCTPHAVMLPFPETGHINPLMELAKYLSSCHGFIITFVNTQYNHSRIVKANAGRMPSEHGLDIRLVGIPDGLSDDTNRDNDVPIFVRLIENIGPVLEELICKINADGPHRVTCIISDVTAVKTIDVAQKLGIPRVAFWPPNATVHSYICHAAQASYMGEFNAEGVLSPGEMVIFPGVPSIEGTKLPWVVGSKEEIEAIFRSVTRNVNSLRQSEWVLCNSVHELEATVQDLLPSGYPKVCPIGPIIPREILEKLSISRQHPRITTSMWTEQDECLEWLDLQEPLSVMYVSVGSIAILNKEQLLELAHGLEASRIPILWVLRADLARSDNLLEGYKERTEGRIKIVEWCPQLLVLSHKAVGAFLTHCGWNSTLEAMSMGVPMLAWPQLVDQFVNAELVVHEWRVGMELGQGFVGRAVVESKVKKVTSDDGEGRRLRRNVEETRRVLLEASREGGSSHTNLLRFVYWMKEQSQAIQNGRVS